MMVVLPDKPDGMATLVSSQNKDEVVVIRNHEINPLAFGSMVHLGLITKKQNQVNR